MAILKVHQQKSKHILELKRNLPKEAAVRTSLSQWLAPSVDWRDVARVTIDMLSDVALLNVFDFYLEEQYIDPMNQIYTPQSEVWRILAHVCQRWRNIVFESPRRLDLRVYCRARTPVREMLDIWPKFPVIVWVTDHRYLDNTIAALEHNDRVCGIYLLDIENSRSEKILAAMKRPFPALTRLVLKFRDETALVHPASFLGGCAQRLQSLFLRHIPFPGLPTLLLSATHLVSLLLWRIPHSGYFSPDAMVTSLSVLTRLEALVIDFTSPRSRPTRKSRRLRSLPTRTLLPVLNYLQFKGVIEYLEDLVACIDAPLLDTLNITFFHKLIFDTPQLAQFISRTPKSKVPIEARVAFSYRDASIGLHLTSGAAFLVLSISSRQPDWQLLSLARLCSSSFPQALIPVERLSIEMSRVLPPLPWQDESSQWLELLHSFPGVKDLIISSEFTPGIASALQELVGERVTEVLPSLRALFLEETPSESVPEAFRKFVAARQLAGHPISVSRWNEAPIIAR
jgi:hypothetical protein